ncbi:MAG: hypothetical protein Q8922_07975 [Bacteroidota bacterium]|nr:hypothetical protein [Bacteroidota bacterium]MDP4234161.1 hypothetical protein [Bacteroidota bacterium]MDP4244017.1 hypothetical protein [Bacteroidota bacterium]MDP4287861.1 hypothetical protein [Bacteroidota bacterium]
MRESEVVEEVLTGFEVEVLECCEFELPEGWLWDVLTDFDGELPTGMDVEVLAGVDVELLEGVDVELPIGDLAGVLPGVEEAWPDNPDAESTIGVDVELLIVIFL